jgi:hypothetical protein
VLITMFTDCSYNRQLRRATWAAWAKADGVTIRVSGVLRAKVDQSGDGEIAAIANGLAAVKRAFAPPHGSKIIAQTDSTEAIHALRCGNHVRSFSQAAVQYALAFVSDNGWRLELRHVKGHCGAKTPRHAVNTWCDKECSRLMGKLLATSAQGELNLRQEKE